VMERLNSIALNVINLSGFLKRIQVLYDVLPVRKFFLLNRRVRTDSEG
jgi:hypothetical protein